MRGTKVFIIQCFSTHLVSLRLEELRPPLELLCIDRPGFGGGGGRRRSGHGPGAAKN